MTVKGTRKSSGGFHPETRSRRRLPAPAFAVHVVRYSLPNGLSRFFAPTAVRGYSWRKAGFAEDLEGPRSDREEQGERGDRWTWGGAMRRRR